MPFDNISIVPPAVPGISKDNNSQVVSNKVKVAPQAVIRNIAPLTKYNPETGTREVDESSPWGAGSSDETSTETSDIKAKPEANRHDSWKAQQVAKKQQRAEQAAVKQAQAAGSVKELLAKGDLVGAANALNMSPADLLVLTQNAALKVPTPEKELTPEQKKAKEEETFHQEVKQFRQQQESFNYQQIATSFIRDNIDPVLADKEKFELIHAPGNDVKAIKNVIYEYMNKHYLDTCVKDKNGTVIKEGQVLNPADIAETIENQLYETAVSSAERLKSLKKTQKLLSPAQAEALADALEEVEPASAKSKMAPRKVSVFQEPTMANKKARPLDSRFPVKSDDEVEPELEDEEQLNETYKMPQAIKRKTPGESRHFAFLTREEKMAIIKAENRKAGR